MIGVNVKVTTKKDTKNFLKDLKNLSDHRVLVGVPFDTDYREKNADNKKKGKNKNNEKMTNATLAYIHDNGAPSVGIPARPFMKPGIAKAQNKINAFLKKYIEAKLDGNKVGAYDFLFKAGLVAQNSIRNIIRTQEGFEPIKRATALGRIRKRNYLKERLSADQELKEQYIGSFNALIDTGQLLKSITFVIEKIKK